MEFKPHTYQEFSIRHVLDNPESGLFLEPGLGKTVITLTAWDMLDAMEGYAGKTLVIAPKRVALHTWPTEVKKWEHLRHLKVLPIHGTAAKRMALLKEPADIYAVNRDMVKWLVSHYGKKWPFEFLIIDELSSFKNHSSHRFKALRTIRPLVKRVVGLTGTPAPQGLHNLWSQMYLIDRGVRLGKTVSEFRDTYCAPDYSAGAGVMVYKIREPKEPGQEDSVKQQIYDKIGDICVSMKSRDWLKLPGRTDVVTEVILPESILRGYKDFERSLVMELPSGGEITAVNAASLCGKLRQYASGAIYSDKEGKNWYEVHREKIDCLDEMLEELDGEPAMVFYQYKHEVERIMKYLKHHKPKMLTDARDIDLWNSRKIPFLLVHEQSAGHGLNMQDGGHHMIWYSLSFGTEYYLQARARLDRQGQRNHVINRRMVCPGTIDTRILKSLDANERQQEGLMEAVKALIAEYRKNY